MIWFEIAAHLLDLVVDRTALRRLARKQREETGTVAAHPLGLRGDAIEFALLLGGGFLVAPDLLFLGRIAAAAAAVDGRQLRFQPRAHRIERRAALAGGGGGPGFICAEAPTLSATAPSSAAQAKARDPAGQGSQSAFQHIQPLEIPRRPGKKRGRSRPHIPASRGSVTSFPGRRCGGGSSACRVRTASALAGDGDVFVAAGMVAVAADGLGNRAGDFIGIDAPIRHWPGQNPATGNRSGRRGRRISRLWRGTGRRRSRRPGWR